MRLLEYQAKQVFVEHGIKVPKGFVANSVNDVENAISKLGLPVILKSQVLAGGRGKAGAIRKASTKQEAKALFQELMAKEVQGEKPSAILVEEFVEHADEAYVSIMLDRSERRFVLIVSAKGGVDVEAVAEQTVIPLTDSNIDGSAVLEALASYRKEIAKSITGVAEKVGRVSADTEAELVEINPLAIIHNVVIALDAKIIVDDNALYRHPELAKFRSLTGFEIISQKYGFNFVEIDGNIAVIGNGAGLVLSTLDLLIDAGGKPACFLDLGGGATKETVFAALETVSKLSRAKGILLNIFGGITSTPDVAQAISDAYSQGLIKVPFRARILGVGDEEATKILVSLPVSLHRNIDGAVRKIIADVQRIQ